MRKTQEPSSRPYSAFLKYCAVGGLGTAIDLCSVYFLSQKFLLMHPIGAATIGFFLAVTSNFVLNKNWTFNNRSLNYRRLWIKFFLVSIVGLSLTWILMYVLYEVHGISPVAAKAITSLVVLAWNFFANKHWTFRGTDGVIEIPTRFTYALSIIIPAYNEANRIVGTLRSMHAFLDSRRIRAEIIVVNDGSTDSTIAVVSGLCDTIPGLKIVNNVRNYGKGFAVKTGVEVSRGEYILVADADNSTPIEEYERLSTKIRGHHVAIGSRWLKESKIMRKQSKLRIFISRFGNALINAFLINGIADTQCGFKFFTHEAAKHIFSRQKVYRFGFDIEALVIARNLNYSIVEVPVSWFHSSESRFRPMRDAIRTFFDLIYIKVNLWSGRYF